MKYKILALSALFTLILSCSDEKVEPEFPEISQTELNKFLSKETISLNFGNTNWNFGINEMQIHASNFFINYPVRDSVVLASGLLHPEGQFFSLHAGVIPFNSDSDVLKKHFSIGDQTVASGFKGYSIAMSDLSRPNSAIELLRVKVVKVSLDTQLYWNYQRKIKVWFLIDFNIRDSNSGALEKFRNAKYINEFFLIDFTQDSFRSGRAHYDEILTP